MSKQIFTNAFVDVIGAQKGVFSKRSFSRGDLVLETTGEFAKKQSIYTIQVAKDKHFTPDPPVKFLNHSCDPNLGVSGICSRIRISHFCIFFRKIPEYYRKRCTAGMKWSEI
eukprot:TRINITY_DN4817_c0_g1_i1.p1 TRINITY_DN4817_c0_g1~~TRINITY_DN4817_c0_g1_i1.p1  ORF type:complete len:112 (+),score=15.99 TRINITY_DN4817_c0_g1_i1:299-634(+)